MRRLAPALTLVLLAAACAAGIGSNAAASGSTGPSGSASPATIAAPAPGALANAACSIPHRELVRIWRGTDPERSGQIVFVPTEPNYVGTNFPHSGPWDYLQDVPLLWYGPGIIPALGSVDRPVTLADVAPTQAKMLGFGFDAPDGHPLDEIPKPQTPPPLIVTLVWDAGGRSVLDAYPNDWPVLRSLIDKASGSIMRASAPRPRSRRRRTRRSARAPTRCTPGRPTPSSAWGTTSSGRARSGRS